MSTFGSKYDIEYSACNTYTYTIIFSFIGLLCLAFIVVTSSVQQQAENAYSSREFNQCVTAQYVKKDSKTFWGYDIGVYNVASNGKGKEMVGELCASVVTDGQLQVAPCFLPKRFAGPYWIVDYQEGDDDNEGYALISGGQPKNVVTEGEDVNTCGVDGDSPCCKGGDGVNNSGLWIFTRQKNPPQSFVDKVRTIAKQKGFATSILFDVTHPEDCDIPDIVGSQSGNASGGNRRVLLRGMK
jgi:lipocalin